MTSAQSVKERPRNEESDTRELVCIGALMIIQ